MGDSEIRKYYENKKVFVTGATGFLGKILVEKLLRSTDVATVYILVRNKKGKNLVARVDELFDDPIFERLRGEVPKFQHKIVGIEGDCRLAGLGIGSCDRETLQENVNVVFHIAATVRFDEHLKTAYAINVNGTREICDLSRKMAQLHALVHVSTAYSNCHLSEIDEKFYDYPMDYHEIEPLLNKLTDEQIEKATPRLLGPWPNTYTFTKALAESFIRQNARIPTAIFRPAIIISTNKEPIPGWADNFYGAVGVTAGVYSGFLRAIHGDPNVKANVVPVDSCASALIAIAWDLDRTGRGCPIYNYVSCEDNPISWQEFAALGTIQMEKRPYSGAVWRPRTAIITNSFSFAVYKLFCHYLPAVLCDCVLAATGNRPRTAIMTAKIDRFLRILHYFYTRDWRYETANSKKLWKKMNATDRELFPMDIGAISWLAYFRCYVPGIRRFLFKDSIETLPQARNRLYRFELLHGMIQLALVFVLGNFLCTVAFWLLTPIWRCLVGSS